MPSSRATALTENYNDDALMVDDMDSVRADLRRKQRADSRRSSRCNMAISGTSSARLPDLMDGSSPFASGIPLSEDDKKSLALNMSAAAIPGAYDSASDTTMLNKLSQDQLREIHQIRNIQKDRLQQNLPNRGLEECQPDLVDNIDALQATMTDFDARVGAEHEEEDCILQQRNRRRKIKIILSCVLVVVIFGEIVAIVIGLNFK